MAKEAMAALDPNHHETRLRQRRGLVRRRWSSGCGSCGDDNSLNPDEFKRLGRRPFDLETKLNSLAHALHDFVQ
jgi:hypothetical protein